MDLIEVDPVGLEPLQAGLDRRDDVAPRAALERLGGIHRDAEHARHLYRIGVTDAVPETIEASLQLSEAALVGLGIPMGPVIASFHEQRDGFRHQLQEAAAAAGHETTRSIRAKARRS